MTFDFNTLKDNTFCIYDVKEGQVERIKAIMEELGMENIGEYGAYYFVNSFNGYALRDKNVFDICRKEDKEAYRKTATEFLKEYEEWKFASGAEPHYKQYIGKKYAVHCKTQEEWDNTQDILFKAGYRTDKDYANKYNYIKLDDDCYGCDCDEDDMIRIDYTILSVAEFFGEEEEEFNYYNTIKAINDYMSESFINPINEPNIINKTMNTIKRVLRSKEDKALDYFDLGTSKDLNDEGRTEFLDFIYETGTTDKKEFLKKIVKAYEEAKK